MTSMNAARDSNPEPPGSMPDWFGEPIERGSLAERAVNTRLEAAQRACPDGFEVLITGVRVIEDLQPGDMVMGYRADNGHRGRLRVRAVVVVARQVKKEA